ncbi:Mitochondrial intermediate peptidase [Cytospora mali]|uniref:Mitochondrial intermediate peptidase n=1 Tax=Cytospora mali TaxID=578113 RepID=A0A194VF54_CYTMA|nr:Mitochondrial intermediate peptidase [Valsa mali var. pyri (nom. inval.)]
MIKFAQRPAAASASWVCSNCLRRKAQQHIHQLPRAVASRWQHTAATTATHPDNLSSPHLSSIPPSALHTTSYPKYDDSVLRQIFDSPSAWLSFSGAFRGKPRVGLFRNAYLTEPQGFLAFARVSLARAQDIVDKVLTASSLAEYRALVRDLDRLSDLLCRVIDLSDFVRVTHPDRQMQAAASEAWTIVYQYMNQLNTTTGLNEQLGKAMANPEVTSAWSEEEMAVAEILKLDFTKSAVSLPQESRDKFVDLSSMIGEVGQTFVEQMAPEQHVLSFPSSKLQGLNPTIARRMTRRGQIYLPALSAEASLALRTVHDEDTRKAIYYASRTASSRTVKNLENLLKLRAEIAELSGFESYGHMALRDRMMAKTPESVHQFLRALCKNNAPIVQREMEGLLQQKQQTLGLGSLDLKPWDKDYYMNMLRESERSKVKRDDILPAYFSLGTIMQGLSRLFTRLYGIRFAARETMPGETWHPDVRRLDVISDTDGHVAVLYCDLFYREDKSPNPAHFTVRCSREIAEGELDEAESALQQAVAGRPEFASPEEVVNDGMAMSRGQNGLFKQLPTIALVCDFPQSEAAGNKPAFLTFGQMETLFHEMGHAIHSILARTSLQNVSGTRCATDLAELPSTLMEHFCADPEVLSLFARHYETDEPLDYQMVVEKLRQARRFEGTDNENQILLAMLDQEYHSPQVFNRGFDSTESYRSLQLEYGNTPADPSGCRWQGFFGHLFGYGSTYYSYLFDRVLAERVWKVVFSAGRDGAAVSRENGEQLKENLLKWGGSRDPWKCLADTLRDDRLANGDEKAMALVGSWGTGATVKE